MWQAWPFWSLTVYTAEASLLNCLPTSVCERPTNCCRDNRAKKTGAVRVCVCDFKVEGVDDDDDEERRQVIDVFFVWIFSFYPNKRRREKKFTALSSSRCHWCLLNFIFLFFFQGCIIMTHNQTHTLYRLSTQCGLIQLHDNLVTWQTDHLDCLFPRGFFSICVWKWRVKSLVQNKRKEERPPHPLLLSLGVSILACGRANFKKPKRKKEKMMMIIII